MSTAVLDAYLPAAAWTGAAIWLLVKATIVLLAAAIAQALIRRRASASTRHLVWTCAVAALLLLPALSLVTPGWRVPMPAAAARALAVTPDAPSPKPTASSEASPAHPQVAPDVVANDLIASSHRAATTADAAANPAVASAQDSNGASPATAFASTVTSRAAAASAPRPASLLLALYAAGVLFLLLRQFAQWLTLARLARRAHDRRDPRWLATLDDCAREIGVARPVRLLRSREQTMPMAFGTRHPAILVPATADLWSEDRRRAVLLHELAHVARFDCLTQMSAAAACALYWPHPGVWWIARRLRIEREIACDDRVLASGAPARDYASHLLEIAYSFGAGRAPALAVSMARQRHLEGRMLAVLDAARNRTVPGLRGRLAGAALTGILLLPLAGAAWTLTPIDTTNPSILISSSAIGDDAADQDRQREERVPASAASPGTWEVRPSRKEGMVQVQLRNGDNSHGFTIAADQLNGLLAAQRASRSAGGTGSTASNGPVRLTLRREAGSFHFEGVFREGIGAGTYTFAPDPAFADALAKRGFARPGIGEQFALARADIGLVYLDEAARQGYARPDLPLLVRAGNHGAGLDYLRGMDAQGYRLGTLDALITLRDHGVTPDYISGLAAEGYKGLPADGLRRARDHGITSEYVREMRSFGYTSLDMEALINARDHGISADYVRALDALGIKKVPLEDIIRYRDHGLSADYIRGMRELGYNVPLDELQKARDHGISVDHVRALASLGYGNQPLATLIRARDHGVDAGFVRDIKAAGYPNLTLDELAGLRDHGVTADRIRKANARAGTQLPIDMLRALADRGWR